MTALLDVEGLTVRFGGLVAVKGVDLRIETGSIHGLIGPNGAGKSTFVNALTGMVTPSSGAVVLKGRPLQGLKPHQIAAAGICRTFQNIRLFGGMTVLENTLVGSHRHFKSTLFDLVFRTSKMKAEEAEWVAAAIQELEFTGIARHAENIASTLPYGHQRRLEIARALLSKPDLLLLDEPMAGMNSAEKDQIAHIIRLVQRRGITVLLIEHDMQIIRQLSDRVTVLHHGEKLTDGVVKDVFNHAAVKEAYLGRAA